VAVWPITVLSSQLLPRLSSIDEWVIEFDWAHEKASKVGAKSDELDAIQAAREVIGRDALNAPRTHDGHREALRVRTISQAGAGVALDRIQSCTALESQVSSRPRCRFAHPVRFGRRRRRARVPGRGRRSRRTRELQPVRSGTNQESTMPTVTSPCPSHHMWILDGEAVIDDPNERAKRATLTASSRRLGNVQAAHR